MYKSPHKKIKLIITTKLIFIKIIAAIFLICLYFLYNQYSDLDRQLVSARHNLSSVSELIKTQEETIENLALISKKSKNIRIENAIKFLQNLLTIYSFNNMDLIVLKEVEQHKLYNGKFSSAQLMLKFSSTKDEVMFQFIDSFIENFPGAINVEYLQIIPDYKRKIINTEIFFNWYSYE